MKLQIVPARQGVVWFQQGVRTFMKQPLAFTGLFFMFMAAISLLSLLPVIGTPIALALLPAATLGLMAATEIADKGQFPMPQVLIAGFRAGKERLQSMVVLGVLYAVGFILLMGISATIDGGQFARVYLMGGELSPEVVLQGDFQTAALVAMVLYLPLSLLFWHAPALVHWHGISPVKSLFFSAVACLRNFWAFTVFGMVWMAAFLGVATGVAIVVSVLGNVELINAILFPLGLAMAAMFFTSFYFTYRDCFDTPTEETP
ncbi:BPSS1780 family membrane protein [Rhodoferax mekongensis]|uniref:BPSS1780 family membrane protein n=1 Tax=Rhodoferax mekongensis TaxID=3068341 RepID=A0ABZ0B408_9BURK|nr:BPSS1780 family membrane protein [Rhodoferax sp. TBRC 17307]WNO06592.1 BPSS1780 family membrane protein [Rhodoferax sp. TBRC 17307]